MQLQTTEGNLSKIQLPIVVTPSRVELGLRCQRRHTLADILQVASYYSPSLEFGSVIHAGAAAWWSSGQDGMEARKLAQAAILSEWRKRFEMNPKVNAGELSSQMALAMLDNYMQTASLSGPFELEGDWQLVSVEDRLEVPLVLDEERKAVLSFQTDRVVWNKDRQHLVVIDTKTAGRFDKRWAKQWETSLQMKLYKAAACTAYDMEPENVSVVVEGVLKDVPSTIQYEVCPEWSKGILTEAVNQARIVAIRDWDLIASSIEGVPRDKSLVVADALVNTAVNYMSCREYGVECPFYKLCTAEVEERVAILNGEYFNIPEEDQGY